MTASDVYDKIQNMKYRNTPEGFVIPLLSEEELRQIRDNPAPVPEYQPSSDNVENKTLGFDGDNLVWR